MSLGGEATDKLILSMDMARPVTSTLLTDVLTKKESSCVLFQCNSIIGALRYPSFVETLFEKYLGRLC